MSSSPPTLRSTLLEHWHLARTLRTLAIHFDPDKCAGIWQCYAVCPMGCWTPDHERRVVVFHGERLCVACGACVLQCPEDAIVLK